MRRPSLWERPFILRRCEVAVLFHLGRAAPDVAGESVGDASGGPRDHRAAQTPLDEPEKAARGSSSPKREAPGVAMSSLGQPSRRSLTRPGRNVRQKGFLSWITFTTAYLVLTVSHNATRETVVTKRDTRHVKSLARRRARNPSARRTCINHPACPAPPPPEAPQVAPVNPWPEQQPAHDVVPRKAEAQSWPAEGM